MRRNIAAEDDETVCIWVCRLQGTRSELGARADRKLAQAWVERRLESDGEWHEYGHKYVYQPSDGLDSGIVELVAIHDAVGMIVEEP
jgi:hypothetical protein